MSQKLQQQLQAAGAALNDFDWQRAGEIYTGILKQHPDNAGALMGLAMLLNRSGKHVEALELLRRIWVAIENASAKEQSAVPALTRAEILAQMALAMQLLGQEDAAIALYENANKVHKSPKLEQRIAALRDKTKNTTPIDKLVAQAQKHASEGRADSAMTAWRDVLKLNPDHDIALHGLGDLHRQRREFQQALPLIQQAIIMQPRIPQYHNTLGMLFQQKGEFEKALIFHRRAIDLDSKYAAAHCNLGVALKNLQRLDDAVEEYRKALEIDPAMPEAHNNLGNLYRMLGRFDDAKASLLHAVKLRPGYPDAKQNLDALEQLIARTPRDTPRAKASGSESVKMKDTQKGAAKTGAKQSMPKASAKVKPAGKAKTRVTSKAANAGSKAGSAAKAGSKVKSGRATKAGSKAKPTAKAKPAAKTTASSKKPAGAKAKPRANNARPGVKKSKKAPAKKKSSMKRR
ncbi:MAG TPA: tetratricopeptide repeat protein [Pseudomonadales bacterium]